MNGGDDSNREWEEWVKLRESKEETLEKQRLNPLVPWNNQTPSWYKK